MKADSKRKTKSQPKKKKKGSKSQKKKNPTIRYLLWVGKLQE